MSDIVARLTAEDAERGDTWIGTATVTNIAAKPTTDGRRQIGLLWQGTPLTAPFDASYTPVLGNQVTFLKAGASLYVIGTAARI